MNINKEFKTVCAKWEIGPTDIVRQIMRQTGAVVTGSVALAAMHPGRFEPGDLDFFVPRAGADILTTYVVAAGYDLTFKPPPPDTYEADDWDNGRTLRTKRAGRDHELPFNQYSTVVMNYIAQYGHVCLSPEWTNVSLWAIRKDWDRDLVCIEKYRSRGYDVLAIPADILGAPDEHDCSIFAACPSQPRQLHNVADFTPFEGVRGRLAAHEDEFEWKAAWACRLWREVWAVALKEATERNEVLVPR